MTVKRGKLEIDERRCKGCELCIDVCPKKVIVLSAKLGPSGHYPALFRETGDHCTACRLCVIVCPDIAITLYQLEPGDLPASTGER